MPAQPAAAPAPTLAPAPTPPTVTAPGRSLYYQKPADGPAAVPAVPVKQVRPDAAQPPGNRVEQNTGDINIQTTPPNPEQLFGHLDSEESLEERIRQEARSREERDRREGGANPSATGFYFPPKPELSKVAFAGRSFSPLEARVEPNYVCYGRLLFEEKNSERYGWDLGVLGPFVSSGYFFRDVLALPYNIGTDPCRCYDCSAGHCLPGSPVPYLLYPPNFNVTGGLLEAGTIVVLYAVFP
jgi:hypothetical protein